MPKRFKYPDEAKWTLEAGIFTRHTPPGDPVETDQLAVYFHNAFKVGLIDKQPTGSDHGRAGRFLYPEAARYCLRAGIFTEHTPPGDVVETDQLAVYLHNALS